MAIKNEVYVYLTVVNMKFRTFHRKTGKASYSLPLPHTDIQVEHHSN
jgi:hypothetical protein